jgi:hypothetical protein
MGGDLKHKFARFAASMITIGVPWSLRHMGLPTFQSILVGAAFIAVYVLAAVEFSN